MVSVWLKVRPWAMGQRPSSITPPSGVMVSQDIRFQRVAT